VRDAPLRRRQRRAFFSPLLEVVNERAPARDYDDDHEAISRRRWCSRLLDVVLLGLEGGSSASSAAKGLDHALTIRCRSCHRPLSPCCPDDSPPCCAPLPPL